MSDDAFTQGPPEFTRSGPAGEWLACRYDDVRAVLADDRFEVPPAADDGAVGTIAWLRASVSRFSNGAEHQRRRAVVTRELARLDPASLRARARHRTLAVLDAAVPGERIDVMARLARVVPMATLAGELGAADPGSVAQAAIECASGYFGGTDAATSRRADAATARLVDALGPGELDTVVARIALLIQGCDATAGLIGTALHLLQDTPGSTAQWPVSSLLAEVLRHSPPVRASRRVAAEAFAFGGHRLSAGDRVVCSVDAANRDPAVFERPEQFDVGRTPVPSLTFGYGVRPCPGVDQALMLAAGVIEPVRERCRFLPGEQVDYEPSAALRIPLRLDVVLR